MLNNNHKNSTCAFAEQIISYLYGEAGASEKAEFELHLQDCSKCADELAGLDFARSSIVEWRDAEFSNLQGFVIPFEETAKKRSVSAKQNSWLTGLRQLFSFPQAQAAFGLAFLIVCVGAVLFMFDFSGNNHEIAENKIENSVVSKPEVSETKQIKENALPETAKQDGESAKKNEIEINSAKTTNIRRTAPENLIVKTENKIRAVPKTETIAENVNKSASINKNKANNVVAKNAAVKNSQVPKLTNFEEEEDKSLRLADLLAEFDEN